MVRRKVATHLQRHVADLLVDNGHNAVHVSDIGLRGAPDEVVLAAADEDNRILITALNLVRSGGPGTSVPGRRMCVWEAVSSCGSVPRRR
ncbi:MAG: DUF5615 family PIN-like protein [Pseudonocardiaceae bacterium]